MPDGMAYGAFCTIGGVILGWLLSWWTSAPHHRRTLEQLGEAAQARQELRHLSELLLRALHNAGVINIRFDPDGKPLGDLGEVIGSVIMKMSGGSVHEFAPKPQGGSTASEGEE